MERLIALNRALVRALPAVPVVLAAVAVQAADLSGTAAVVSADTLDIAGTRVTLWGIQGPEPELVCTREEKEWDCGRAAADFLRDLVGNQVVQCDRTDRDGNGVAIARCRVRQDDLALKLVLAGYGFAQRDHGDEYSELEGVARRQRRGLWAADFLLSQDERLRTARSRDAGPTR